VPLEILHRAAPCRNVPVTFTLCSRRSCIRLKPLSCSSAASASVAAGRICSARSFQHCALMLPFKRRRFLRRVGRQPRCAQLRRGTSRR